MKKLINLTKNNIKVILVISHICRYTPSNTSRLRGIVASQNNQHNGFLVSSQYSRDGVFWGV